jgi:hypothetical protein
MHGSETPKVHRSRQPKLLDSWLEMPPQQITTIHSSPALIRKHQIFRFAIFRPLPCRIENSPQDSERIKRNAPTPSIGLRVVEFAFVKAFYETFKVLLEVLGTHRTYQVSK